MVQKRKINYEDFDLIKVRRKPYGIDFMWREFGNSKGRMMCEYEEQPHKDFIDALNNLIPYFAERLCLNSGLDELIEMMPTDEIIKKQVVYKLKQKKLDQVGINGVIIDSNGTVKKLKILGYVNVSNDSVFSLGCPVIRSIGNLLGYEDEVFDILNDIKKEAYNMLFLGKITPKKTDKQLGIEQ